MTTRNRILPPVMWDCTEGPLAAVLVYLAGWLGGKRRQIAAGLKRLAERVGA